MPKPTPITAAFQSQLDRCGYLLTLKAAADAEPWRAELTELLAEIRGHYDKHPADVPIRAAGTLYYIDLSKREFRRTVTSKRLAFESLKRAIGLTKLIEALSFPFKLLDEHVDPTDQSRYVTQARTGSRDVTAVLKNAPEAHAVA